MVGQCMLPNKSACSVLPSPWGDLEQGQPPKGRMAVALPCPLLQISSQRPKLGL